MIVGRLEIDGVELGKIEMPESRHEIRYGQYLDFAMLTNDINDWLTRQINEKRNYGNQYRTKLAYATATIYNIDPKILLKLEYDGIEFLEKAYSMINKLIIDFVPEENASSFNHKGKNYKVPMITEAIFRGTNNLPKLSFQQLVEISETERLLDARMREIDADQKDEVEIKGTIVSKAMQKSHQTFLNTLKKIILCVTPWNEIPVDDTYDIWMEEQLNELKDISMPDALNVIFFLRSIPNNYETLIGLGSILSTLESLNIEMKHLNNMQNESEKLEIGPNAYEI